MSVLDTLSYVRKFAGETLLVKLGGAALQDSELVRALCEDFALIRSVGVSLVIVHGGGPSINDELKIHGVDWSFINGQRVTSPPMMDIVEMVLSGSVNSRLVRTLNDSGVPAVGISGTDGSLLQCRPSSPEFGQVGAIENVDSSLIQRLLKPCGANEISYVPVIAPVGAGAQGRAFNINADWAAVHIALALGIKKLLFLTDQDGILNSQREVISELDVADLESLMEKGIVQGGMYAKTRTMLHALKNGVKDIHILNARRPYGLIEELFTHHGGGGTVCRVRSVRKEALYA